MKRSIALCAALIVAAGVGGVAAQQQKGSGSGSGSGSGAHSMAIKGDKGPSSKAYAAANMSMHKGMDIKFSGDADVDFVKGMIPHHQGAVDMAKIVLKYGKDPELKKLADEIVAAQEKEIAFMNDWLKKKGK